MRFLLLSLLVSFAHGATSVLCGTAAKTGFCVMSSAACTFVDDGGTCKDAANGNALTWWKYDGGAVADDAANACSVGANPLKTTSTVTDGDGYYDTAALGNHELKWNYVAASAADDQQGKTAPTDAEKGFAVLFDGESYSSSLKTALEQTTGADAASKAMPAAVICASTSRGTPGNKSKCTAKIDTTADVGKTCIDGTITDVTDALAHNAVGATGKKCYHLPWEGSYISAATCTATQKCDRFVESGSQCIDTTKIMSPYTAATTTVNHCVRWDTAGSDDKYRHMDKDLASKACATGQFCNTYSTSTSDNPACLNKIIGTSAKSAARQPGAAESATVTDLKYCLGTANGIGAKKCATTEVCNPHSATRADLCINKTDTTKRGSMAFGAVGADAPAANDLRPYCIGDNAAGAICAAKTVCNYAGGDQSGTAGGAVCLPHTSLLGDIADTAAWTAAAQRKVDGVALKHCLATDGTTYSSKICATTEKCNPHASNTTDICIKSITILNHGDIAPAAAEVVADSVRACIGKSYWKLCASEDGDTKEVCNEGASALTDVCISTADCINPELPMEAFREAGVEAAEDQKWCFATDGAAKCGLDTICNPSGSDGGTASDAICADATKSVPHGEAATDELIHCYGNKGNAVLATDDSEDGFLCDQGKGEFIDPKSKMDPRSKNETPDPLPEGEVATDVCFGKDKVEKCDVGVYCNSMGTETGCSDAGCTTKNICITEESLIAEGEQWVEDGKSVCLNADATAGEDCTADKMYCDQTEGVCSAEEIATTDEPSNESEGGATSGCAAQSLAAAAVVAILSA